MVQLTPFYKKLSILFVEDEKEVQEAALNVLERYVDHILVASDGEEALAIFKEKRPDIVITDIKMPVMDGLALTKEIKELGDTPVIVISAFDNEEFVSEAARLGVETYLLKPIDIQLLLASINRCIELLIRREEARQNRSLLREYKRIVDETAMICKIDLDKTITYANEAFCQISGYSKEELTGKIYRHMVSPRQDLSQLDGGLWVNVLRGKSWKGVIELLNKKGEPYFIQASMFPLFDADGKITELIALQFDITEHIKTKQILEKQNQKLEHIAHTDTLTGVWNRYKFNKILRQEIKCAKNSNHPFSLMLLDVDRFKTINDTHGHQFGDRVLKAITSTLKRQLKHKEAMIARWGGEEFIILAQGYRLAQALELAERLRAAIEGMEFENIPITSSFGVTEFSPEDELDTLVRRADLALYTAKESGRNCIISY